MKIFNQEKVNRIKVYEKYFLVLKLLRIPLIPLALLTRALHRKRPKYLISDGYLIGDTVLLRALSRSALRKSENVYFMGGPHCRLVLSDIPVKLIISQWPWATYNYKILNLLRHVFLFLKIFILQPEIIVETRGDFRSILFLYMTCPEKIVGYSFTGGRAFLDLEPENAEKIFHLELHNQLLARSQGLDYESYDIRFSKKRVPIRNKIGISFSGSQILKTLPWSLAEFILDRLLAKKFRPVYIISPDDHFLKAGANEKLLSSKNIETWKGNFSDYFSQIQSLNGYIGMDSGGGHLAAMFQIPSLIIFGTQNPDYCRPVGNEELIILETKEELFCRPCNGTDCSNRIFQKCLTGIEEKRIENAMKMFFAKIK